MVPERPMDQLASVIASLECKQLCAYSCTRTFASKPGDAAIREYCEKNGIPYHNLTVTSINERHGEFYGSDMCKFLKDGLCSIYPVRPIICKIWGAGEVPVCKFGCKPRGKPLTLSEVTLVIRSMGAKR